MHRSSIGLGRYPFKVERWVRFPYGVPFDMLIVSTEACKALCNYDNKR